MQSQPHLESYTARPTGRATEISVWHVAVSSDDVKVMTLEQLDDAFRLDVIDTSTPVWKAGMSTWSPLGIVAGIDDEPTTAHVPIRQAPAALWPPPAWPPQASTAQVNAVSNRDAAPVSRGPAPPVLRPTVAPSGPNVRSAAPTPSPRPAAPTYRPAPATSRPAEPSARPAPAPLVAHFAMPASVPPAAYSVPPQSYARPKSSSGLGSWIIALALVAGLLVTLYRNDLRLRAARAARIEPQYLRIEKALLGGPSFGTLRSVAALKIREQLAAFAGTAQGTVVTPQVAQPPVAAAVAAPPAIQAKPAETQAPPQTAAHAIDLKSLPVETEQPAPAATAAPPAPVAKAPVKAPPAQPVAAPKPTAAKPSAPVAVAKKDKPEKPAPAESEPSDAFKAAMAGKGAKAPSEAPAAKEAPAKSEAPRASTGGLEAAIGDAVRRHPPKKKKGAPGSEYDPLNGDL